MERNTKMQNSSIIMVKTPPPKNLFNDFSNYGSRHEFNSARNSIQVSDSNKKDKSSSINVVYCTIKSRQKKEIKENNNHSRNLSQLPQINQRLKEHLVTKYFNRYDIVKDRAQQKAHENQTFNTNRNKLSRYKSMDENDFLQSNKEFNNESIISHGHLVTIKKYNQLDHLPSAVSGRNIKNLINQKQALRKNQSLISLNYDKKPINRRLLNESQSSLEDSMRQWQIIKKKNQFQMYKMKRKNDLQRMRSNFIIAEALNQMIEKRQRLLLDEKFEQLNTKLQPNNQ